MPSAGIDPLAQALMGLSSSQGRRGSAGVLFSAGAHRLHGRSHGSAGDDSCPVRQGAYGHGAACRHQPAQWRDFLSSEWFTHYQGKPTRPLADTGQYGLNAFHRLYEARDGWLYVVADTPEERQALCRTLDAKTFCANTPTRQQAIIRPIATGPCLGQTLCSPASRRQPSGPEGCRCALRARRFGSERVVSRRPACRRQRHGRDLPASPSGAKARGSALYPVRPHRVPCRAGQPHCWASTRVRCCRTQASPKAPSPSCMPKGW